MKRETFIKILKARHACDAALNWIEENPDLSPSKLYRKCPNTYWMWWITASCQSDLFHVIDKKFYSNQDPPPTNYAFRKFVPWCKISEIMEKWVDNNKHRVTV